LYEKNITHANVISTATAREVTPPAPAPERDNPTPKRVTPARSFERHGKRTVPCIRRLEEHLILTSRAPATRMEYLRYARRIALWCLPAAATR
jgi:hypothetical protein